MARSRRPLKPQKAANLGAYIMPKWIDGHYHPPIKHYAQGMRIDWQKLSFQKLKRIIPQRNEQRWRCHPDFSQYVDNLLTVAAFSLAADGYLVFEHILQCLIDRSLVVPGHDKVGCLLKPFQSHPLTESYLACLSGHSPLLSICTKGTMSSSIEMPPWLTIRRCSWTNACWAGAKSAR